MTIIENEARQPEPLWYGLPIGAMNALITPAKMNTENTTTPAGLLPEHLTYLDKLRETGATNMFGARPYLQRKFGMPGEQAKEILLHWMRTFGERHP